ncbi:MAG TPA: bifunctional 5,10-methylene-tetrahydrofolate dehydrogenase/5,10-methylene-tetrahydrofolate cyclohydrolase [Lachnospiraceae bacterium]|nr:bifunctional 5,10-methylene-tetrahydrofolate dehydrogenase/5,10-methylene-tetrahydrofolate cyclohydrolase [Lachnospiraceae bacterium]
MAELLKGKPVADALTETVKNKVTELKEKGMTPTFAILRVGEKENDLAYERGARKRAAACGIEIREALLPEDTTDTALQDTIRELNQDPSVHGILMFCPLPKNLDERAACALIDPAKDVDGITAGSMAGVYAGNGLGFCPCTAQSVMEILKFYGVDPKGKRAVVVGRSLVIGRPVAMLLLQANATVTICHTKTVDLPEVARNAQILVCAAGHEGAVGKDCFSQDQVVIDVGINYSKTLNKLVGDADFAAAEGIVSAITPVPGGVGSVTTAVLMDHVVRAAAR